MAESKQEDVLARAKRAAGEQAVKDWVKSGMTVGIGSGSTIVPALKYLASLVRSGELRDIICVPTSFQSKQLILEEKLRLGNLDENHNIDVCIDGADEIDENLNCIKGGGGCHLQEKMVAYNSKKFVIIGDYRKNSKFLGDKWKKGVPLAFLPASRVYLNSILTSKEGVFAKFGLKEVTLRMAKAKMGPVITDNGFMIYDVDFGVMDKVNLIDLNHALHEIPGVVATGLFVNMAHCAYIGTEEGKCVKLTKKQ